MIIIARRAALGAAFALLGAAVFGSRPLQAREVSAGALRIANAWTRAMRAGGTGAGFMTIRNTGSTPDRLLSARSPLATVMELHTHIRDGDVMRMRPVPAIDLPPGQEVRLVPGGFHLMLIGLTAALEQGGGVPVTLVFERAGEVEIRLAVESAGARGAGHGGHGGGHRH
jgi:copper(I)-binding protein